MFLFLLLGLLSTTIPVLAQEDSCQTPDNQSGRCIAFRSCLPLFNLILKHPIPSDTIAFLRESHCGFNNSAPKVCCPSSTMMQSLSQNPQNELIPDTNVCGINIANKLLGGEQVFPEEFPWMALLEYTKPNGKGFHCGGVLITSKYVLTAAHCVNGRGMPTSWKLTSVRLGEYNINTDPDCIFDECAPPALDIPIESTVVHPEYVTTSKFQENDIALLRLKNPAQFSDLIQPVCLPLNENIKTKSFAEYYVSVVGWGTTEIRSESDVKLQARLPIVSESNCTAIYQKVGLTISNKQICVDGQRVKNCRSDSGGPLVVLDNSNGQENWYVIGVMNFLPSPCDRPGWPGVYTKVSNYTDWISKNILP